MKKTIKKSISKIDEFLDSMSEMNPDSLYPSDMKEAIIGYVERAGMSPQILLSRKKCIDILVKRDKMSYETAEEYFSFNTIESFMGNEGTPCFATLKEDI
jgi:hypothetical protein